jgi:uncharacterized protein
MIIGVCTIELMLPGISSLKGKRGIIKSMTARLRNNFNVSVVELDDNDLWQSATLGVACISNNSDYAHGLLSKVVQWVEDSHYDIQIIDWDIELI